jgi:hypothetical protein
MSGSYATPECELGPPRLLWLGPMTKPGASREQRGASPIDTCDKCGSTEFREAAIHGGASTRRDCARCGRFMGFPKWAQAAPAQQPRTATDDATTV